MFLLQTQKQVVISGQFRTLAMSISSGSSYPDADPPPDPPLLLLLLLLFGAAVVAVVVAAVVIMMFTERGVIAL